MKKLYRNLKLTIILCNQEDVVRTSGQEELAQDNTKAFSGWDSTGLWED